MPLERVVDAEDVVDHGGPVGAGVEEGGAVRAAEVHRREEVAERARELQSPRDRCRLHLGPPCARGGVRGGNETNSPERTELV